MGWNDLATGSLGANLKMLPALHWRLGTEIYLLMTWPGTAQLDNYRHSHCGREDIFHEVKLFLHLYSFMNEIY